MHYEQYCPRSSYWGNRADRMPSLLAILIHPIQRDQPILIFKNKHRQLKAHPRVLPLVLAVLSFIPLIPHLYIHIV